MIRNADYAESILAVSPTGIVGAPKSFRPIRPVGDFVQKPSTAQLIKVVETKLGTNTSPVDTSGIGGVPKALLSIAAAQSPIKQQTYTDSEVTVNFTFDPSDTNFDHVNIWVSGYHGNANAVLVASGRTSPIDFILDSTGEAVTVYGQTASSAGQTADVSFALSTVVTLSGVVTNPPAPTISQTLTATPLGYQFSFNQVNLGSTEDVIDSYRIYKNSSNSFGTATLLKTFRHDPTHLGAIVVQDNVGGGNTFYYWATSVNTIGLESSAVTAQSGAVVSGTASLDSDVSNGTVYIKGVQFSAANMSVPNANFEASASTPIPGWNASNATLAYETGSPYAGTQSLKVSASSQFGAALSVQKWACAPGDQFFVSAAMKSDGTSQPDAQLIFVDSAGAYLSGVQIFHGTGTSWTVDSGSGTAPANTVACYVSLQNNATSGAGLAYFDNIVVDKIWSLETGVSDGSTRFAQTGSGLSYRPLTNPLTATDAGANATVSVASFTMRTSSKGDISISSGSITALSYNTAYYIYYDDASLAGGAVTFNATTTRETAINGSGRFFVGSIVTPVATTPDTVGQNDGGAGAQVGGAYIFAPGVISAVTTTGTGPGSWSNLGNATDGDLTSKATYTNSGGGGGSGSTSTVTFSAFGGFRQTWSSIKFSILSQVSSSGLSGGDPTTKTLTVSYSTNGGASFTTLFTVTGTSGWSRAKQTDTVTLAINQNPAAVQLKVAETSSANTTGATLTFDLYDMSVTGIS